MGWTSYNAKEPVNAKKEMDAYYGASSTRYTSRVLKSKMVGSVYYAAVEDIDNQTGTRTVWAGVALTSKSRSDGMNFGYKSMDETMGPAQRNCPLDILALLTPTMSNWANDWREDCRRNASLPKLKDVKVGDAIIWHTYGDGGSPKDVILTKMSPNFQFKRNWWYNADNNCYVPQNRILKYDVVKGE